MHADVRRDPWDSFADARRVSFWLDQPGAPEPAPPLAGATTADLAIVGGGFTGLWTALLAKERDPAQDVVLLEDQTCGWAASGRNGGFCNASLTHGLANGASRFPAEIATIHRLGMENLDEIEQAVRRYRIDCDFQRTGELNVAVAPWQIGELADSHAEHAAVGHDTVLLDRDEVLAEVNSPTYLAGLWDRAGCAMLDPARLVWGLRATCLRLGVRIFEHSPVKRLDTTGGLPRLATPSGVVVAQRVALGTGPFPGPLWRLRPYLVPVYDYAMVTEPLSAAQLASVGWANRQGVGDAANQFHYYRLTADNRILWGGYDAVYYAGGRITPQRDQREATFRTLAEHFFATFPSLAGLRFTHRWGGVIDTCSRFSAFYGTAHRGRVAYAVGHTGLGVGATRFGAAVMLDLLSGVPTERTRLAMVRSMPVPFPPEPLRTAVIAVTRRSIASADRRGGRRNLWLRTLDRLGLGFDS